MMARGAEICRKSWRTACKRGVKPHTATLVAGQQGEIEVASLNIGDRAD
jgi:hypothetical protein